MKHRNATAQVNQVVANVRSDAPTIEIQHYSSAGAGLARVIARVVHTAASRANPGLVMQAIRDKFDNRMCAVAGSLRTVDKGPVSDVISGVLAVVRESRAIASSNDMQGFKAVASNMFLDDEDRIWALNKTESGSLLVRTNGIDDDQALIGMLAAVASSPQTSLEGQRLTAMASAVVNQVEAGRYVSFVNANNQIDVGFVAVTASDDNTTVILTGEKEDMQVVDRASIVEVHDVSDAPKPELTEEEQVEIAVASSRGNVSLDMILGYYRKVFAASPAYYEMFAQRVRSHAFA